MHACELHSAVSPAQSLGLDVRDDANFFKMGPDGHVLTFPIAHGTKLNVVAFRTTSDNWDYDRNTKPSSREAALRDFAGFGKAVTRIIELTEEEPTVVCPNPLSSVFCPSQSQT